MKDTRVTLMTSPDIKEKASSLAKSDRRSLTQVFELAILEYHERKMKEVESQDRDKAKSA